MIVAREFNDFTGKITASEWQSLLRHVLGISAAARAAHPEQRLNAEQSEQFDALVARRRAGEPMAYLTEMREFYSRDFRVSPAVLIPRPETELLVDIGRSHAGTRILDLGTGSGCVAITLALELKQAQVTAVDNSVAALTVARDNGQRFGARVDFRESHWFSAVEGLFDLMVTNPPYIAAGDSHLADLSFEPNAALVSGEDGLAAIRHLIAHAPRYLAPGGWLFLEHGYDQAVAVQALLRAAHFSEIEQHQDMAGIVRVSGGVSGGHSPA